MSKIYVAGIGGKLVSQELYEILQSRCETVVCSEPYRLLLAAYPGFSTKKWLDIVPVGACLEKIRGALDDGPVMVITSGDPLFYGLGRLLLKHFPSSSLRFLPGVSSMQTCFARFALPWDDAQVLSLHGRDLELLDTMSGHQKLFVFTDKKNSPGQIARYLMKNRPSHETAGYLVHVGERLAMPDERLFSGSLAEVAKQEFSQPNCMILINDNRKSETTFRLGLKEDDLFHSRGLITKNEVRAAVLHSLRIPGHGVLWDIGAGSGSVSIETALLAPGLSVYAIEKNENELQNIKKNRIRYHCSNVSVIAGEAPQALGSLPIPDRVFIGGSGGNLEEIIDAVTDTAHEKTIIAVTAVTEKTANEAPRLLHEKGFLVEVSLIQTTRYHYPDRQETIFNPIHLIVARRKNA